MKGSHLWKNQSTVKSKEILHLSQLLKGAVVVTHCQNEAELKFSMEIDHQISLTEQQGKSD